MSISATFHLGYVLTTTCTAAAGTFGTQNYVRQTTLDNVTVGDPNVTAPYITRVNAITLRTAAGTPTSIDVGITSGTMWITGASDTPATVNGNFLWRGSLAAANTDYTIKLGVDPIDVPNLNIGLISSTVAQTQSLTATVFSL